MLNRLRAAHYVAGGRGAGMECYRVVSEKSAEYGIGATARAAASHYRTGSYRREISILSTY